MDLISGTVLLPAFALGLLHALDADHVMAVTALAGKKMGVLAIVRLCLKWSLGHGLVIFCVGALIILFDFSLPYTLSLYAEKMVAVLLVSLGLWILIDLYLSRTRLHFHDHINHEGNSARHAHLQSKNENHHSRSFIAGKNNGHRAVMVGVLHGFAGLAPLLAVIPISSQAPWLGVIYLLLFCVAVFISMLIFGGVLGKVTEGIQKYKLISINLLRGLVAMASISLGIVWLS